MTIQVTGILVDPMSQPLQTKIKITAESSDVSLVGAEAITASDCDGFYDFNLVEGRLFIELLTDDEYTKEVLVLIDEFTPVVIDLGTLLEEHKTIPQIELNDLDVRVTANEDAIVVVQNDIAALGVRVTNLEADYITLDARITVLESA
jgi:hypothetical protein